MNYSFYTGSPITLKDDYRRDRKRHVLKRALPIYLVTKVFKPPSLQDISIGVVLFYLPNRAISKQ